MAGRGIALTVTGIWKQWRFLWLATAVLLIMFALAATSLVEQSPTFDEQGFITRGLGYVRGENRHMRVGHPAGLNAYNALLLAADSSVSLPTGDPSWQLNNFHRPSELFMWEIGNDVARVMFLARLPTVWLGLLLAAVAGRWAWQMSRQRAAGLAALILIALDPNILAHASLATTDLGLAAAAGLAGYTLWLLLKRASLPHAILAGIAFGLLQNTKFTAGLFIPLFALIILIHLALCLQDYWQQRQQSGYRSSRITHRSSRITHRSSRITHRSSRITHHASRITHHSSLITLFLFPLLLVILAYAVIAPLTLWAAYGFQIGTLPQDLPIFSQLGGLTIPLSHHLEQLLDIGGRLEKSTPSFLLGQYSDQGWWTYFPVAFVLKTSLPTLILLAFAFVSRIASYTKCGMRNAECGMRNMFLNDVTLLLPALGYFAFSLTTDINLGYRHLLPVLPFLAVFTAHSLSPLLRSTRAIVRYTVPALLAILLVISLWIYPHFLSYFNVLAGGPDNGWRALVDSNIDWGQDLGGLKGWMDENGAAQVYLSYFGEGRPEYYGIDYIGLDSWPPRLMNPEARPFYPQNPAPGLYAISATTLQGVHFATDDFIGHDRFAWFREQEPLDKVGYSIFLYEIEPTGEPVDLALGGLQLDELDPADFALLGTNDVTPHWFDPGQSWLLPADGGFLALAPTVETPQWAQDWEVMAERPDYAIYRYPQISVAENGVLFSRGDGRVTFLSAAGWEGALGPGQTLSLTTTWYKQSPPEPVKIFIHLLAPDGSLAAQWDGLGVPWEGWRNGDLLIQTHTLTLPPGVPAGTYQLWAGLYHPQTGTRWQTAVADRILIGKIMVAD